jgi:drug/metabolite transporter superfamily protein YnfA
MGKVIVWLVFILAAVLEVAGAATVRRGLRGKSLLFVLLGCAALGCYGLMVNAVKWDFSRLIGVYVGFFALVSVLVGRIVLREQISPSTWWGLALIIAGGLIIQFGRR